MLTQRVKGYIGGNVLAIYMAAAVLVLAGPTVAVSSRAKNSPEGIGTTMGGRSLAGEIAGVKALAGKRDPFKVPSPRVNGGGNEPDGPLPPGVRGLVIGQIQLKGIVREDGTNTMIAVVTGNSKLAYFLRIHDEVYNGVVSGITADSIRFIQRRLDEGGLVETREVVLKLGSDRQEAR